jgi:hypothetical protein
MKKFLEKYPVFLLLLPLFIVLHVEKENHRLINYNFVIGEFIFIFAAPVVAYLFAWPIMRSVRKAGFAAVLILIVHYFFGEAKEKLKIIFPETIWQSYTLLLPLVLILLIVAFVFIRRSKASFARTYLFLNVLLLLFIVADAAAILFSDSSKNRYNLPQPSLAKNCTDCVKPDIYYLVFDSYSSTQALKEHFNYDNSGIDSALTAKGFRMIPGSRSNYNLTPFSIGSQFSFDYLPGVDTSQQYFMRKYLPAIMKVYQSPLLPMMHELGYTIYNHSIFDFNSFPTTVPAFDMWNIYMLYQRYNLLKKLDRDIGWHFPNMPHLLSTSGLQDYSQNRDRHDSITLAHLAKTIQAQNPQPKFVYGHILVPHSPYTYDSAGNKIEPIGQLEPEKDLKAYLQQIGHVNRVMTNLVDNIFQSQKRPFVIIIQGDHGYRFFDREKKMLEFPNFNAIYFYNRDYRLVHDSLTNVNTFPVIFNTFFGQQLPMRQDHQYFLYYK